MSAYLDELTKSNFEVKPWDWSEWDALPCRVSWVIWKGDRQVAWFTDKEEAEVVAEFLRNR